MYVSDSVYWIGPDMRWRSIEELNAMYPPIREGEPAEVKPSQGTADL